MEAMQRTAIPMMENWCFRMPGEQEEQVQLPHTWNHTDGQDGGNDYKRLECEYFRAFATPSFDVEKQQLYLELDGVNSSCSVYINDMLAGKHDGGYSTFRFEITELLKDTGEENQIKLLVDNSVNDRVYPQKADFTFYGGIYREVRLLVVPREHFALNYFGGNGLKLTPRPVNNYKDGELRLEAWLELPGENWKADSARDATDEVGSASMAPHPESFDIEFSEKPQALNTKAQKPDSAFPKNISEKTTEALNLSRSKKTVELLIEIFDAEGSPVLSERIPVENGKAVGSFRIYNVHLWNGVENPYLYTVKASLYVGEECKDSLSVPFGVRDFFVDEKKGFFLNGRPYPLHGVSRHQDRKRVGNALTEQEHREDMALIRELGANTVRLAHYQHSQCFYELCDRAGMVVWAEIPYISEHLPKGRENTISQMRELIVQNYHHPSICFWGISNEITISTKDHRDMMENHEVLNRLCHEMDETRLTTLACYAACLPWDSVVHKVSDLVGYNYYLGWYTPFLWLNDVIMKLFRLFYPKRRLCYSEYGAEGMPNLHSRKPRRGDQTEEYQLVYLEYMLKFFDRNPWLWGNYLWNMFDFAADARDQGGEPGMNHKGLVSFDRKTKKDSFYLYKAWWASEPVLHITGKRRQDREETETEIRVYSNQKSVSLYVDGELYEEKSGEKIFTFRLPMKKKLEITVRSGALTDSAVFYKVERENPAYRLKKGQSRSANWT